MVAPPGAGAPVARTSSSDERAADLADVDASLRETQNRIPIELLADICIRTDGQTSQLELPQGGRKGHSARAVFDELLQADQEAVNHRDPDVNWRDISWAHERPE